MGVDCRKKLLKKEDHEDSTPDPEIVLLDSLQCVSGFK